ncbi:MAG: hypothetical protein H8E34_03550 [Bacteroidetes bacterium]|nr:hypothetical protein [Bacteroidota bacterium]MBL6943011.1 hypothetical protein [Bacteroidales bacterium]
MTFTTSYNTKLKEKVIPNLDPHRQKMNKTYSTKINFKHKKLNEGFVDIRNIGISGDNYYHKKLNPPHSTGAALDLTLKSIETKELLFMGNIFDDVGKIVYTDYYEKVQQHSILTLSEEEAQKNRRLLYWCMKNGDFENFPTEWWHFSFGDQAWAVLNEQPEAFYSCIDF